jgi:LuxR family transcriptional regulator, maltose regulon positive regulatory protein
MAAWLACDQLDFRGAPAVAAGWLRRAHRLLDPLEAGPDHGWLAFMEGYLLYAGGDSIRAAELARRTTALGERFGVPDLEMLGLALEGASLVSRVKVEDGMRCLDEATTTALEGQATVPISGAWACCFLVTACIAVLDYERAFAWCDRIAEFAERYGSRYMLAFCRAEYGAVHLWRGRWPEAETVLESSVEDFASSRPAWAGGPLVRLAELRRRQGRARQAEALLERAASSGGAQLCRARLALDLGQAGRAAELAERVLRQTRRDTGLARAPALELLVRARTARGELELADSALEELRAIERRVGTRPLRAVTDLAEGTLAAAYGEHERARRRSRTPWTGSNSAVRPTTPLRRGSSWPPAWRASAARMPPAARRTLRGSACWGSVRMRRPSGRRGSRPPAIGPAASACPASPRGRGRCCTCSPRASRTGRSPNGWYSASTPSTAT